MKKTVYTKEDIFRQLREMGAAAGGVVLAHASLRAVGAVEGGAEGLLGALIDYFTADGGLFCVPTHTWHNLDRAITLDVTSDDTCLGALPAVAIRDGRGMRSESPTHSMVVFGDPARAAAFIADEVHTKTPTARKSCYGKLYDEGGKVLLIGVAQNRNTYLHAVEELLDIPNRMGKTPLFLSVRRADGEIVPRTIYLYEADFTEDISFRFPKFDTAFRYHGCITDGFIGDAPTQLCDARKMADTMARIYRNSDGRDPLATEEPIPQKLYCNE